MKNIVIKNKVTYLIIITLLLTVVLIGCRKKKSTDLFELVREEIILPTETTSDLNLPTTSNVVEDAKLNWVTKKHQVISKEGFLIRPDEDTIVKLELFVSIGMETRVFEFEVKAKGWESQVLDLETFKNPAGFASLGITNRLDVIPENIYVVNNELEFLDAYLASENKSNVVIEITNDLNLGARYIGKLLQEAGLWDGVNPRQTPYLNGKNFRENTNLPQNHPTLLEHGIGQLMIDGRNGLMIYSKNGATISHLTVQMKGNAKNIVFRNLQMQGIWEWDEIDRGDYKALDWDYFTIEFASDIWLDHLTFKTAYDGIVDVKGGVSNITLSWLNLDFTVDQFINDQFTYLENNIERFPFYRELRQTISKEDIATVAAGQKKAFNFGNTEGGPNFESITVTMHNIYAKNLQDRFPRLRRGDVHVYNVVLDSEEIQKLRHINMKVISQAIVPTEQGAVLMENSRFIGVNEPIKTHQSSNLDFDFTGKFKIVDSEYIYNDFYYRGNSNDSSFLNPWKRSNQNINYDLDFYFRNYENLPYDYTLRDANKLTKIFKDNPIGAGLIPNFNWLEIKGLIDPNEVDKGIKIDETKIIGLDSHIAKVNESIESFTPQIYNYYTGQQLIADRHYVYYVDNTNVDMSKPGIYDVVYTFVLLHNDASIDYIQKYVVYDPNLENEIYDSNIGRPFDNILSGQVDVYEANGDLYYYLSNSPTVDANTVINDGVSTEITTTTVNFENANVENYSYIHFVVDSNDRLSKVFTHKINKEVVVEIRTNNDFNSMILDLNSKGKYYKLMNDLDFTDFNLFYLSADYIFQGVFDGQNYTISNLNRHAYGGGIFHTLQNAKIKNIIFDNVTIDIHRTEIIDEETGLHAGWQGTSARSGIIAGQIKGGFGIIENITIMNSLVKTDNNYGAMVIGKVEGYSQAEFKNITIINSKVDQDGEYAGGITAGVANYSTGLFEDIYINGLDIIERNSKMIGTIVGRAEVGLTIKRVVIIDVMHNTSAASGGVIGKDDRKGQALVQRLEDIFVDVRLFKDESGQVVNTSQYIGNLVGNPDLSFGHTLTKNNIWGTPIDKGSSGINADNIIELTEVDNEWWQANFSDMLSTGNWEIKDDLLVLKK